MEIVISKVPKDAWKSNAGRKPKPIKEEFVKTLELCIVDKSYRATVIPEEKVQDFIGELRRAGRSLNVSVRTQKLAMPNGYVKVMFNVTKKISRPRNV